MKKTLVTLLGVTLAAAAFSVNPAGADASQPRLPATQTQTPPVRPSQPTQTNQKPTQANSKPTKPTQPQTKSSRPTKDKRKSFKKAPNPTISGTAKVGKTLKAKAKFDPKPTYSYQWYRDGKAIKHATKSSYKLVKADKNKKITVKVTGSKSGYKAASRTSEATTVK
ncbi:MAG: hypothetical protein LBR20_04485 [Propionibacteriaceae bacterium]|jgi:hypothetical protein|nr:hypothetical protein [Propionibacteriaceae bacterium]